MTRARSVVVLTTAPANGEAERLARTLVAERLAACVHVHAEGLSIYRWQGGVEEDRERQLVIKTAADRVGELRQRIRALHSYDVPELVVLEITGCDEEYLTWLVESTRATPGI